MKKQFLNLGKALNKAEQKQIFGGELPISDGWCVPSCNCGYGTTCKQKYCDSVLTWMCV
ncbi:MAG: hypothetical protein IBX66_07215 [Lutibacter sp.]|nr:hypothetical protein [Lutibacter sp.]